MINLIPIHKHTAKAFGFVQLKELCFIIIFFGMSSIFTFCFAWFGTSPISAFFIGEIIIGLFIIDFLRIKILMHVYQIILVYFYCSLVVFHSLNDKSDHFYYAAYFVSVLHFLFFIGGYHLLPAKNLVRPVAPRQNMLSLVYMIFGFCALFYEFFNTSGETYNDNWLTYEESQNLPIYQIYLDIIYDFCFKIMIYLTSHPIVVTMFGFLGGLLSYPMSGVKGPMVISIVSFFVVIQVYLYRLSFRSLILVIPLGAVFGFLLIGSSGFRGDLSAESLILTLNDLELLTNRWSYFILTSPESSHIRYTTDIMHMIEDGVTNFRYGFDHYRFFLYPFKSLINGWELASYNQYPILVDGVNVSAGLYLGLAGELFWNFGWFFPLFSLVYGLSLKWFTNYAFSGNFLGFTLYLIMFHSLVWHFYRGQTNAAIITIVALVLALMILKLSSKIKQVRLIVFYITKFTFKRTTRRSRHLA